MRATDPSQLGKYICKKHGEDPNPVVHKRRNGYIHRRCRACYKIIQRPLNKAWNVDRRKEARARVLAHYGGKCYCCGETLLDFLTIDHLSYKEPSHKGRHRNYGTGNTIYRWLESHGFPSEGYAVACFNCNLGRAKNGGVCPHKSVES